MVQVLDYSTGRPGGSAICRPLDDHGQQAFVGAVRYIGFPGRGKCTDSNELGDFSRCGLGMALVYEDTAGDWRKGYTQGVAAGQRARAHATSIGFPAGRPIYMAIDQDVTAGEYATMLDYLRGAAVSLGGPHLTGVYGEADVIDQARTAGVAAWFWQTAAWSAKRRTTAHLFQHVGTVTVGGVGCDINDVLSDDWGQHNYVHVEVDDVSWTDTLEDWELNAAGGHDKAPAYVWAIAARRAAGEAAAGTARIEAVLAQVLAVQADGGIDPQQVLDRVDTAVREATDKAVTQSVLPAVARLEAALAADNTAEAKAIVAELGAQLRPTAA
jgi:hypothetical protein